MTDMFRALSDAFASRVAAAAPHLWSVRAPRRRATAIAWSDELLVTTAHPLFQRESATVVGPDGDERTAELVARDPATDLALLKVTGGGLAPATWAGTASTRVGELALSLGRPGASVRASLGLLQAVGPAWRTRRGVELDRFLEVDGDLPRGFSGGPLVTADGIVGVNTHDVVPGGTTLPSETVARVVDALLRDGSPARGYLGLSAVPAPVPPEARETVGADAGVLVLGVEAGGPAAAAGLLQGDLIVAVSGRPVSSVRALVGALAGLASQQVPVRLLRAGQVHEAPVTLGRREVC